MYWNREMVEKFSGRNRQMIESLSAFYKAKGHKVTIEENAGEAIDYDYENSPYSPYTGIAVHFDAGDANEKDSRFRRSATEAANVIGGSVDWVYPEGSSRFFIEIPKDGDEVEDLGRYVTVWTVDDVEAAKLGIPPNSLMVYGWLVW